MTTRRFLGSSIPLIDDVTANPRWADHLAGLEPGTLTLNLSDHWDDITSRFQPYTLRITADDETFTYTDERAAALVGEPFRLHVELDDGPITVEGPVTEASVEDEGRTLIVTMLIQV